MLSPDVLPVTVIVISLERDKRLISASFAAGLLLITSTFTSQRCIARR
jgi:hypothetical protein